MGTEPKKNLYQRMLAAMEDVRYVQKERGKDGQLKFSIVTHDAVTALCRPALMKHGIFAYPTITSRSFETFVVKKWRDGAEQINEYAALTLEVKMVFVNADDPSEMIFVDAIGIGVDQLQQQDKCAGKALSYACKFAFLKGFALETGDEAESDYEQSRGESQAPLPDVTAPYAPQKPLTLDTVPDFAPTSAIPPLTPAQAALAPKYKPADDLNACADTLAETYKRDVKAVRKEIKQLIKGQYKDEDVREMSKERVEQVIVWLWSVFRDAESAAAKEQV